MDAPAGELANAKIIHAPANVAGIAGLLAEAQRDLGFNAVAVEYVSHPFSYGIDKSLNLQPGQSKIGRGLAIGKFALNAAFKYDVFHLYFGSTLFPRYFDLPLLRLLGKRLIFHYCGCDIRDREITLEKYDLSGCSECTSLICKRMHHLDPGLADQVFVSTPDLLEFAPGAHLLPGPIDLKRWTPRPVRTSPITLEDPIKILHAPSDRDIKGTKYVIDTIERLKAAGYPVELMMLEGVPHSKVVEFCDKADLAIDQLMIGAYGTVSIEMLAKGIPVICRIREDLRKYYPADLPIIDATPHSLFGVVESLLQQPDNWTAIGQSSLNYVRREHEMHSVAKRALETYELGTEVIQPVAQKS